MICISEPASACKTGVDGLVEAAELIGLVSVFPVCACVRFVPAGKVLHECILKWIWLVGCFLSPCELIDFERCITCSQCRGAMWAYVRVTYDWKCLHVWFRKAEWAPGCLHTCYILLLGLPVGSQYPHMTPSMMASLRDGTSMIMM